jgi:SAM-dependent methyltransferase
MKDKICPVCSNHAHWRLKKQNTDYHQCTSCLTLFSDPLDNSNMVGGGNEVARNEEQNHLRIERIDAMCHNQHLSDIRVLDFGCGHFMFGNDLISHGYRCDGYDVFNEKYSKLPEKGVYDIVTMVEVIEHTSAPFAELDVIHRSLVPGGIVMIETSFVNISQQEGIELEDFFYIDPSVGHSTIFSHHGLDVLMCLKGFKPISHWNRHVRGYQKISK